MTRIQQGDPKNLGRRRALRSEMTHAERRLWYRLRGKQMLSLKFRRQHGIGSYIVDFYCPEKALVIEVDGDVHAGDVRVRRDQKREEHLKMLGLKVIRYTNNDVLYNLDGVLEDLRCQLLSGSTSPGPSLQRRGEPP